MPELFVGLMSGTSLDGIDAVIVDFENGISLRAARTTPFHPELKSALRELVDAPGSIHLDTVGQLDARLGEAYAEAVNDLRESSKISAEMIRAIGCHGQTIRHRPDAKPPFTWQLGDAARIAALTGIPVVADFRRADVALGGQGAPLVPAFHRAMFAQESEERAVVNIGGIANITRLGPIVSGYDTGPGNGLMDAWIRHIRREEFDKDGAWAKSGVANEMLLADLAADPFFQLPPPRSTGREHFHLAWLLKHLERRDIAGEDVQATLLALTVKTIAGEATRTGATRLLVCGGGARNVALLAALRAALPGVAVETTNEHGLDSDFVEAAAFAWLARERLAGRNGSLASVTGAERDAVLGGIYLP